MNELEQVEWLCHPEAGETVQSMLDQLVNAMPRVARLQEQLAARTSTRLIDWIDHVTIVDGDPVRDRLRELGFEPEGTPARPGDEVFYHPGALFPRLILRTTMGTPGNVRGAAIGVEDIAAFLVSQRVVSPIKGPPLGSFRTAQVWELDRLEFWAVERRWYRGCVSLAMEPDQASRYLHAYERWATREHEFEDARAGMEQTLVLARSLVSEVGVDVAAWVAFQAEQDYWQQGNWAGQVQRARQDSLGLGWANRDHMAFRSSRETFRLLIQILETLGFKTRERFYAGAEAGWGAQVLEHPTLRLAVFADVDLAPDEVEGDFAHLALPRRDELGTIGLWCGLHGESMLGAGTHHLACRLDFDAAATDLARWEVDSMSPFSEFPYLQQAFTRGERWPVDEGRLNRLVQAGLIDEQQRERFASEGAAGSHMENIQRDEGFKGFDQQTVSDIIRRTDPRAGEVG
jgi:hypothetical protein